MCFVLTLNLSSNPQGYRGLSPPRSISKQITLPSLNTNKTKNIGKILIEAKYLLSDDKSILRYHGKKIIKATKLKIAKPIEPTQPNYKEMDRRHTVRNKLYQDHELIQGKFIPVDNDEGDIDIDIEDVNTDNAKSDDVMINDMQPTVIVSPKQKSRKKTKRRRVRKNIRNTPRKYFCKYCRKKGYVHNGKLLRDHEAQCGDNPNNNIQSTESE